MSDEEVRGAEMAASEAAWERFLVAEQRALVARAEGILSRVLGEALAGESQEELDRWSEEDRRLARHGLVQLMDEQGNIYRKHIDELEPWDAADRLRAETAHSVRLRERAKQAEAAPRAGRVPEHPGEPPLSRRELVILRHVARGLSNRGVAREVHLAETTVKRHLADIYPKIGVNSRGEAVAKGVAEGWLALEDLARPVSAGEVGSPEGSSDGTPDGTPGETPRGTGERYRCAEEGCAREVVEVASSREKGYLALPFCHGREMKPAG